MKGYIIMFSPTGGTEKVAQIIADEMKRKNFLGEILKVDLSDKEYDFRSVNIGSQDFVLIAVPSFGGRVPTTATQRLSLINGNGAKTAVVCVYGNRDFDDTLVELRDSAKAAGFVPVAAVSAVAQHSIATQYGKNRPDDADASALKQFAEQIIEKVAMADVSDLTIPGNTPYKKEMSLHLAPKAGNNCNNCGLCADICPTGAINKENVKLTEKNKCISCMRCVALCPKEARKINGFLKSMLSIALKKSCSERKDNQIYL